MKTINKENLFEVAQERLSNRQFVLWLCYAFGIQKCEISDRTVKDLAERVAVLEKYN